MYYTVTQKHRAVNQPTAAKYCTVHRVRCEICSAVLYSASRSSIDKTRRLVRSGECINASDTTYRSDCRLSQAAGPTLSKCCSCSCKLHPLRQPISICICVQLQKLYTYAVCQVAYCPMCIWCI